VTADSIFNAYAAAEQVGAEIDRLITAIPEAFAPGLSLVQDGFVSIEDDWTASRLGYHFELRGAVPRQRLAGQLLLAFDLCRPEARSDWPHGRKSLLTCAYAPRYDLGWELEEVIIGMDGRPLSLETSTMCDLQAGGRLLEWRDGADDWNRRAWLFTLPLLAVNGHEALHREIVAPTLTMLLSNTSPDEALCATSAVSFASADGA
jgi:hypothetical protein